MAKMWSFSGKLLPNKFSQWILVERPRVRARRQRYSAKAMPPSPSTKALLGSGTGTTEPTMSYTVVVRYVSVFVVV